VRARPPQPRLRSSPPPGRGAAPSPARLIKPLPEGRIRCKRLGPRRIASRGLRCCEGREERAARACASAPALEPTGVASRWQRDGPRQA
jgi:hypothetical protein